jgi:NAD(P)-dependent dehydrogenase (short-subunit alcohol dehydrogenase family)
MDLGLEGRRALVTGASRGIGLAVVRGLVAEGAEVVAAARTRGDDLAALADDGHVEFVAADLASPDGPSELVAAARRGGSIDILVNNAGAVTPRLGGFAAITDAEWEATWTLTLMATVRTTRAVIGDMVAAGRGTIVTTSSVNAFLPDPAVIDYGAAKAALSNFCKALSKEVGPAGVRVNTVSPGPVSTALWLGSGGVAETVAQTAGGAAGDVAAQAVADTATGRFTTPEEVADLVVMLCGERAGNVTGADFVIDGGLIQTL